MSMPFLERFQEVLRADPSATAIECADGGRYSYDYLWRTACAIPVNGPVILERGRSLDHVAGMLAAMKARVPFVPIDPNTPKARRDFIRADIGRGVRRDVAYVIYTSGSTGEPKGVEVGHDGLVPLLDAQRSAFEVDRTSRFYWMLSPGFDASISDIGVTLLSGGTLFCSSHHRMTVSHLDMMRAYAITHVDLPPAMLKVMDPAHAPQTLRTIVIGGEVPPAEAVRSWSKRVRVVNVYGPTEATICTSMITCDASWDRPRIGKPLRHVDYVVRDDELWIAGPGLALGYRGRPDLDAMKFVREDGQRWYRTGDRVAVLENGDLEFVGRIDRQLKIRGQLVEPGEIERRLDEHPSIARAAVVRHERAGLVGFVVARSEIDVPSVRQHLAATLPAFMIPSRIVALPSLPETVSGKIDHASLERCPLPRNERKGAPATEREKKLVRLWASVLERSEDEIGLDDDLSLLGADSLAALRFTAAAEAEAESFSASTVVRAPTIRALLEEGPHREWRATSALALDVERLARPPKKERRRAEPPKRVLLTGATGRIGRRVLRHLLDDGSLEVRALVRRSAVLDPRAKLVRGDLSRERFGLDQATWRALAEEIDVIVHAGANVNALADYETLRAANVLGTAHVIDLAQTGREKALHHLSTLALFVDGDPTPEIIREADDGMTLNVIRGGYSQSKWVSEQLVRRAALPGSILRLGLVSASEDDLLVRALRTIASLRAVPETIAPTACVDVTNIDYVARAVTAIVKHAPFDSPATLHLAGARRISLAEIIRALDQAGVAVERRGTPAFAGLFSDLFDARAFVFDAASTVSFLEARGVVRPVIDVSAFVREALR